MVNMGKTGFYLDKDSEDILKTLPEKKKSDYVREAIKFYKHNKDKKFEKLAAIPQKVTILET